MVVVKILCYVGLSVWLAYEIYQLVLAIRDKRKRAKAKKDCSSTETNSEKK